MANPLQVIFGSPPGGLSQADAARFDAARRFARQRALTSLASGLSSYDPNGNFFSNFAHGLGGSVAAGQRMDLQRQAEYRQAEMDKANAAEAALDAQNVLSEIGARSEVARHNQVTEAQAAQPKTQSETALGLFLRDPELYKKFKEASTVTGGLSSSVPLSEAAQNLLAKNFAISGQIPSLGMGAAGTRVQILNRAAQKYPNADIAANRAQYEADKASLRQLQGSYQGVSAFEKTALANADVLLATVDKVPQTGNRVLNKATRALYSTFGDPNVTAFNAALKIVGPEFSRILQSGGQLSGMMLTDSARKDIEQVLSGDFTKAQLVSAVNILRQDAKNRRTAFPKQIQSLQNNIRAFEAAGGNLYGPPIEETGAAAPNGGQADLIYNPQTGDLEPAQ